jgi:hypothetical protein
MCAEMIYITFEFSTFAQKFHSTNFLEKREFLLCFRELLCELRVFFCVLNTEGMWNVSLTTADVDDAWTEGNEVVLVLCGEKCESALHPLGVNDKSAFRPGHASTFVVRSSLCVV